MRISVLLAAGSAIMLAGCGDTTTVADPNNPDEIAAANANLPNPEPGQYRTSGELVEFEAPGAPQDEMEMIRGMMSSMFATESTMCLTQEQSEEGYRRFAEGLSEGDSGCEMTSYETSSDSFTSVMTCDSGNGGASTMTVAGDVTGTSMDMTMTMEGNDPTMGEMRMVLRMQSERVGDCEPDA